MSPRDRRALSRRALLAALAPWLGARQAAAADGWRTVADRLELGRGTDGSHPQYAALHLGSSYLRLVPSADAAWATSLG